MRTLRDVWLVFTRYVGIHLRNPVWLVLGLLQPIVYLVLFAPLLVSIAKVPGFPPGGAFNVFVPGLVIQLGLFGAAFVGFSLISEVHFGLVERLRVTPVSRVALLLGRALRDVLNLVVGTLILVVLSVPFGLSIRPVGLLVVLGLQALLGLCIVCVSYSMALRLHSEDSFAAVVTTVTPPLLLLSGVLLPLTLAPAWLRDIAAANPLAYAVNASRAAFNDHLGDTSVVEGVVIVAVLAVVSTLVASRAFERAVG